MEEKKEEELIEKYQLLIFVRNGIEGLTPGRTMTEKLKAEFLADRPEIVRLKPKIISILKRKEADRLKMEEIHREQVMKQVKNGTLPIVVREVTHFVGALDMEVTENQIEADTDALIDLFGVRYNGYYTNLPPGNYTVADLPEWKKRHENQIMMNEKIQKAKETGKPVLVKQYTTDCDGSEVDCSMDKITEYVLPDGSIQRQRTHLY